MNPDVLQGHWIRQWIRAPGFEDATTRVSWMQCGLDYADVRIPLARPPIEGAQCLCDLSISALENLAQAEGFAGRITLDGTTCTWHRHINWHGEPQAADIGEIRFDQQGRMIETGVEADYTELWDHETSHRTSAQRFSNGTVQGVLVSVGDRFVMGVGQPGLPSSKPMLDALQDQTRPEAIAPLFDGFHARGYWDGKTGVADLATNPLCERQPVLTLKDTFLVWHRTDFWGQTSDVVMSR